jgi:feruloyl esterase
MSPQNSVNYYSSVLARMGQQQEDWLRLFMVPGMAHCGGGPGPNQVNWMAALERIASQRQRVNMTRPVCPYPPSRAVHRRRQHERRGKLPLQGAVNVSLSYKTV